MNKIIRRIAAIAGASVLAASICAAPSMAASPADATSPIQLSDFVQSPQVPSLEERTKNLSDSELELLESGAPAIVHQEAGTGEITKVEEDSSVQTFALLPANNCSGSITACIYGGGSPYPNYGFTGTGTAKGSWTHRVAYKSPNRTMYACDKYTCYATLGPGVTGTISKPTTFIQVTVR